MYETKAQRFAHPPTGVAILGCGYWGMNYVRVISELPDSWVAVVCDPRTNRLDEVCRRFPGLAVTTDVAEALEVTGVEAVVVCTEAQTHRHVAGLALDAGKHVLVEKPLTTNTRDAVELIGLADAKQRVLLVGHTFIYNAGIRKLKEYIDGGALGDIYYVYSRRTSLGPIRHDVNAVWDLAPHDVAIFNYLLDGPPTWVSAVGVKALRNSREDVGFVSLGFADGVVGHVHVSWADANKVREVVVVGSDRRVVFNDLDPLERVRVFDKGVKPVRADEPTSFGEYQFLLRDGDISSPAMGAVEPLKHVCGHFLHCVRRGEKPATDGWQGADVVRVMEAIDCSVAQRGAPVRVAPLEESVHDIDELAASAR
jgi:predicted dehydrogenase